MREACTSVWGMRIAGALGVVVWEGVQVGAGMIGVGATERVKGMDMDIWSMRGRGAGEVVRRTLARVCTGVMGGAVATVCPPAVPGA